MSLSCRISEVSSEVVPDPLQSKRTAVKVCYNLNLHIYMSTELAVSSKYTETVVAATGVKRSAPAKDKQVKSPSRTVSCPGLHRIDD